jgi:hypothetical protein
MSEKVSAENFFVIKCHSQASDIIIIGIVLHIEVRLRYALYLYKPLKIKKL